MINFVRRERIYILMIVFVLAVNLLAQGHQEKSYTEDKKAISAMTFNELGITEEKVKDFLESNKPSARFFNYSIIIGFFVFITALILNLVFIFTGKRVDFKKSTQIQAVSWGIPDLIRASIIIIFLSYAIGIVGSFVLKFFNIKLGLNLHMMLSTFFIDIAVVWVIFYFVTVKYRKTLQSLGLRLPNFFSNILTGVTAYILTLPLLLVILVLSIWILNLLGYTPPPQPVFEIFMKEGRNKVLFFLAIFVSLLGPIIEEVFFRGFMYSAIRKYTGIMAAAFLSGAIFSLLHTNIVGFFPIMALGILLAYLYETTGSLTASMTVHIIHNSIIVAFVFFIKQLI